ncbi:MAG: hypothetical protein JO287_26300 [Pseudonocardiales bacterium]|nr:hypothetical protein [Pseudonocardiales bacterium]
MARRILFTVAGLALCVAGVGLLIRPGPGLLLLLAGLVLLANEYPWARRMTAPVRRQAIRSATQSVASPLRINVTVLCGLALIAAGIVWIVVPALPFGGVATGSSLIVSASWSSRSFSTATATSAKVTRSPGPRRWWPNRVRRPGSGRPWRFG